jgi:hypothetical protein
MFQGEDLGVRYCSTTPTSYGAKIELNLKLLSTHLVRDDEIGKRKIILIAVSKQSTISDFMA